MRDIALSLVFFGLLPIVFARPYTGIWIWSWIGYMNPHRLAYGFAHDFPFVLVAAIVTFVSMVFGKQRQPIQWTPVTVILAVLIVWTSITTLFALFPEKAHEEWVRFLKIQAMVFMTLILITRREHIHWLIVVIALSIGFYGIKGGLFALATGGSYRVLGPEQTFISGNNEIAFALVMILPLMRYIQLSVESRWLKNAVGIGMALCGIAIISTYSRGGFLALTAMMVFMLMKSRKRAFLIIALVSIIPFVISFMPAQWFQRMETIQTYEEDASARGRINAWWFAVNLANDRPVTGGGFHAFQPELFPIYAPEPENYHDSHSIYFEMLGEQGYPGLFLFLLLLLFGFRTASSILRRTRNDNEWKWAYDLSSMIQASLVGYMAGGLFIGLAYFDLPYHLLAILVLLQRLVERERGNESVVEIVKEHPAEAVQHAVLQSMHDKR